MLDMQRVKSLWVNWVNGLVQPVGKELVFFPGCLMTVGIIGQPGGKT